MNEKDYMDMLFVIHEYFQKEPLVVHFANGLIVKSLSDTGIFETSAEPEDEDYVGEFITVVKVVETLEPGSDYSVPIYNNYIEISLVNVPTKIALEDETVLWQNIS